jgi:hypothetical protein
MLMLRDLVLVHVESYALAQVAFLSAVIGCCWLTAGGYKNTFD